MFAPNVAKMSAFAPENHILSRSDRQLYRRPIVPQSLAGGVLPQGIIMLTLSLLIATKLRVSIT